MEINAEDLRQRYNTMETEVLIELQAKENLTEFASGVLDEVLKSRGITDEIRAELTNQHKSKPRSTDKNLLQGVVDWFQSKQLLGLSLSRWLSIFLVLSLGKFIFNYIIPVKTNRSYLKEVIETDSISKAATNYVEALKKTETDSNTNNTEWVIIEKGLSECMSKEAKVFLDSGDPYLNKRANKETPRILLERFLKACVG